MSRAEGRHYDALILGSGVAGCSAALRLAGLHAGRVAIVTKGALGDSTTRWAQGGIAAVISEAEDSVELHLSDTLRAGAGLCDEQATRILVEDGPRRVAELIAAGAVLDRDVSGELERAREGGHSVARVVHAGGLATGAEVARALASAVRSHDLELLEEWFALDLIVELGECRGIVARDPMGGVVELRANAVVLATGGSGQLFDVTTNPPEATGDGVAMALRAGVAVADVEFVQFHPTALAVRGHPRPLLSEALRGHGALLLDAKHERFVDELAPRDVVSRAIAEKLGEEGSEHVYLDARPLEAFSSRFPSLYSIVEEAGLNPAVDLLPVAPAAHYLCGGVLVDVDGATALPGLWAVGEVACSGVQGANRLASNSLLEGLVFGDRAARSIAAGSRGPSSTGALRALVPDRQQVFGDDAEHGIAGRRVTVRPTVPIEGLTDPRFDVGVELATLQRAMTHGAGVVRSADSLEVLFSVIAHAAACASGRESNEAAELANLAELGRAVVTSALERRESRGAHTRSDYRERDDTHFLCRLIHDKDDNESVNAFVGGAEASVVSGQTVLQEPS